MLRKLKIKYYFWKLKRNRIDVQTVALKLGVSTEKVKDQYGRYLDPFRPIKLETLVSFIAVCISFCSIFLTVETLNEMKKETELAYKPDLRIYENDISLYWDKDGWIFRQEDTYTTQYQKNGEYRLYSVYLNIDNIGSGNAKDIKYNWNYKDNIKAFNLFLKGSGVSASLHEEKNIIETEYEDRRISRSRIEEKDMESYIAEGMQKRVKIPSVFMELLTAYCYEKLPPSSEIEYNELLTIQDFPKIFLTVSYQDIQGLETKKKIEIGFEPVSYEKNDNGEGKVYLRVRNLGERIVN